MTASSFPKWILTFVMLVFLIAIPAQAGEISQNDTPRLAALALPSGNPADWQQWDSFFTNVVKKLSESFQPELRDQLGEMFLDSRYRLVDALRAGISNPVPQLFNESWGQLSPLLKKALANLPQQTAGQYTAFIRAMDAATSFGGLGQSLGLATITPEMLSGAARLLGAGGAEPLAYSTEVDSVLRSLLGLTQPLPGFQFSPRLEQSRWQPLMDKASAALRSLAVNHAHAAEQPDLERLNDWVPTSNEVPDYLLQVRQLLTETTDRILAKSNLAAQYRTLYQQIVFATAWQESCWRQFIKKGDKIAPLASGTGDVGLMQVNRITWRSLYDLKGLNSDIGYNGNAGAEILNYYLTRYAIPKKEDAQKNGNLARATYSAYNAGPNGLGRYRGVRQSPVWKKVDDAFWIKFQAVSSGKELPVKDCYSN